MKYPLPISLVVVLTAAVALIGFDVWLFSRGGSEATISWHTYQLARREPIVPLVIGLIIGILCGHLFWPTIRIDP